jgi:hypothetical protein
MKTKSQIAVVIDPECGDNPGGSVFGTINMLRQLHHQFDIIPPDVDFGLYELLIIPENFVINEELKTKLSQYAENGGALIISGGVLHEQGVVCHGESPYQHTFIHPEPTVRQGLDDYGYVMYERGVRIIPEEGAEVLARVGEPYFERMYNKFCGHWYTPEEKVSEYAAIVKNGRIITMAYPFLTAYAMHAVPMYRDLIGNCIKTLIEPYVMTNGPSSMEAVLNEGEGKKAVHFIAFCVERRAHNLDIAENALPVVDMDVSVKCGFAPKRVYLAPKCEDLPFTYENGRIYTKVTFLDGHAMLMIE